MLITPSFKKSLIVEQFQGNYLKYKQRHNPSPYMICIYSILSSQCITRRFQNGSVFSALLFSEWKETYNDGIQVTEYIDATENANFRPPLWLPQDSSVSRTSNLSASRDQAPVKHPAAIISTRKRSILLLVQNTYDTYTDCKLP